MAVLIVAGVSACASSASRMPPMTQPGYAAPAPVPPPSAIPIGYPAPVPVPAFGTGLPTAPLPVVDAPAPTSGITGLTERQPDLCGARSYASNVGQPGSTIPGLGVTKTYRVVEYRGIEPQDYDPNRIVFRLDAAGTITKIDCG